MTVTPKAIYFLNISTISIINNQSCIVKITPRKLRTTANMLPLKYIHFYKHQNKKQMNKKSS